MCFLLWNKMKWGRAAHVPPGSLRPITLTGEAMKHQHSTARLEPSPATLSLCEELGSVTYLP